MPTALDPRAEAVARTPASKERAKKQDWSRQRLDLTGCTGTPPGRGDRRADLHRRRPRGRRARRPRHRPGAGRRRLRRTGDVPGRAHRRDRRPHPAPGRGRPGREVLALRGTDRRGQPDPARVTAAVRAATTAEADVIAVAVALPRKDTALTRAVAEARKAGAVVVASATPEPPSRGSADEIPSRTYWPAGEPGVLAVADMLPAGARPDAALPTEGIDLAAPGAGVVSGGPRGKGHYLGGGVAVATAYAAGDRSRCPRHPPRGVGRRGDPSADRHRVPGRHPPAGCLRCRHDGPRRRGRAGRRCGVGRRTRGRTRHLRHRPRHRPGRPLRPPRLGGRSLPPLGRFRPHPGPRPGLATGGAGTPRTGAEREGPLRTEEAPSRSIPPGPSARAAACGAGCAGPGPAAGSAASRCRTAGLSVGGQESRTAGLLASSRRRIRPSLRPRPAPIALRATTRCRPIS